VQKYNFFCRFARKKTNNFHLVSDLTFAAGGRLAALGFVLGVCYLFVTYYVTFKKKHSPLYYGISEDWC